MDEIENIKKHIVKKATVFQTGGFKPTNSISESWIGKVYLFKDNEEIPLDKNGNKMIPLIQVNLNHVSIKPKSISNSKIITVFISKDFPVELSLNNENWLIREYENEDDLKIKEFEIKNSFVKPFPLKPLKLIEDYPVWDGGGLSDEMKDKILELENTGVIEDYYDITENQYGHKIGGYPSFCQPGIDFGSDYEFVLQIASDEKANLNIVDGGTIFLAKNIKTQQWKYYCDFY